MTAIRPAAMQATLVVDQRLARRRRAALGAPLLLIASTYAVFQTLVGWWGLRWGYLGGFLFFSLFWCAGFSLWAIGRRGLADVLRDVRPRLPRPAGLWLALLALPVVGGFATVLLPDLPRATVGVLALAWTIAVVNATAEEILWRGVYVRLFPAGWSPAGCTRRRCSCCGTCPPPACAAGGGVLGRRCVP